MDSLSAWANAANREVRISPETFIVSMFCSSKQTLTPMDFSSLVSSRHSVVFRAKREMDLHKIWSIRPRRQSANMR